MTNAQRDGTLFLLRDMVARYVFGVEPGQTPHPIIDREVAELDRVMGITAARDRLAGEGGRLREQGEGGERD